MPSDAATALARVWQLRRLSSTARDVLAAAARRESVARGTVVIAEGDAGIDAFVVIAGRFEVSVAGKHGPLPVAALGPDELFGEVAVVTGAHRSASVIAVTPAEVLRIDGAALERVLADAPAVRAELEATAAEMAVGRFIKSATPLGDLPADALGRLAERVTLRRAPAGEAIVSKGEPGDVCFLVHRGDLDVVDDDDGRTLATLHAGMLFGEAAILTGAPRNATVRAVTEVELYALARSDVLDALASDRRVSDVVRGLLQARSRPRRRAGVELHERRTSDGDAIVTLKDPERGMYFRLSREGAFIWSRLDGHHTVRDLTMDLFAAEHVLAPDIVMEILRHLAASEFIDLDRIDASHSAARHVRIARAFRSAMEWSLAIEGCDPAFTLIYERVARYAFGRAGAIGFALLAILGFAAFLAMSPYAGGWLLHGPTFARAGVTLIPLAIVAIVMHELGHGLAAKAAGAYVDRVGIGWYWLRPIVFVDTSDAWLATRGERMLVDAGGIFVNLALAGIAAFVALFAGNRTVASCAWVFALWSYVAVLRNLNPLLEYDGYYLLMDWVDRPNLRGKSLAWLGTAMPAALREPATLRRHRLELWYGIGSVAYIAILTGWLMFAYRFTVQGWVARIVPAGDAPVVAQLLALAIAGMSLYRLLTDIRIERANAVTVSVARRSQRAR